MPDTALATAVREFLDQTYREFGQQPPSVEDDVLNNAVSLAQADVGEVEEGEPAATLATFLGHPAPTKESPDIDWDLW
jgi:hypothetical protein